MTTTKTKIFQLAALTAALVALAVPAAVAADNGQNPPTTTTTPTATPAGIPDYWTNTLTLYTQYGLVCHKVKGKKKCSDEPLPGTLVELYSLKGKLIRSIKTNSKGFGAITLPGGKSTLHFSHKPYEGHTFGTRSFTISAPIFQPPGQYATFTFCLGSC